MEDRASEFLEILKKSRKSYVITGAGVSVPSGIPDFRGPKGLYKFFPPDIFDMESFLSNPKRYYDFSRERLSAIKKAKPNVAHEVLAELERRGLIQAVVTQNIDGLHLKAGSKNVIEIHGNLREYTCLSCGKVYTAEEVEDLMKGDPVPRCRDCGGLIKPNVVFFGEPLPEREIMEAFKIAEESDLAIAIGTSLVVYPAALIPRRTVETGGKLVIINRGETGLDDLAYVKYDVDVEVFFSALKRILGE